MDLIHSVANFCFIILTIQHNFTKDNINVNININDYANA